MTVKLVFVVLLSFGVMAMSQVSYCSTSQIIEYESSEGTLGCNGYANAISISWRITGANGERLVLSFSSFSTQLHVDILSIYDGNSNACPLTAEYSGYNIPPPITASSNELFLVFTSDDSTTGNGFTAKWKSVESTLDPCYNSTDVVIAQPSGYLGCPYGYGNLVTSSWIIAVPEKHIVEFNFVMFSTESNHDFVLVYDGATKQNSTEIGVYSGTTVPVPVYSSTNIMLLLFETDSSRTGNGFTATFTSIVRNAPSQCLDSQSVLLTEPHSSFGCDGYGPNVYDVWYINSNSPDEEISLTFEYFGSEMNHDFVFVYDGNTTSSPEVLMHSGVSLPLTVTSTSNAMTVAFSSDSNQVVGVGFVCRYEFFVPQPEFNCFESNDYSLTDLSSSISCNGYGNSVKVSWSIHVDAGFTITLQFSSFATESGGDIISIYNDANKESRIGSWSGSLRPPPFTSLSNFMLVEFIADDSTTNAGFEGTYTSTFHSTSTITCSNSEQIVYSDQHRTFGCTGYSSNIYISWKLVATEGYIISLTFLSFNTETGDYVSIFDGANESAEVLGRFSGNLIPPSMQSTSPYLYVVLQSNSEVEMEGFVGFYHAIVVNDTSSIPLCDDSNLHIITQSHGQFGCGGYINSVDPQWLLTVTEQQRITLSFVTIDTEEYYDFIKVYDGVNNQSPLLVGPVSGHVAPAGVTSSSNSLFVTFHSDATQSGSGFVLEYGGYGSFGSSCDKNQEFQLSERSGTFGCNGYANNVEVSWLITSVGIILLDFEWFETEEYKDILEIYDGTSQQDPLLARFSGGDYHAVSSTSHNLLVVFRSDNSVSLSGFEIQYAGIERS